MSRRLTATIGLCGLGGTTAYTLYTAAHAYSGPVPLAGPPQSNHEGPPGWPGGRSDQRQLETLLEQTHSRWAAAGVGSMSVSGLELATHTSIMEVGGFTGSDNYPTLAQFQQYVHDGQVRYFLAEDQHGPGDPPRDANSAAGQISGWVKANFPAQKVNGTTVYDLQAK